MLDAGRELGEFPNIFWLHGRAEDAAVEGPFDLIAVGTAVHWMQHDIVFPRMASWLRPDGMVAIISSERGNEAEFADRNVRWIEFLKRWLDRVGRQYDPVGFAAAGRTYAAWMIILGEEQFESDFQQPLEHYIALQHSTATFARAKMGHQLASEFDSDLHATLSPFTEDGLLQFHMRSRLVWGKPREALK
jgi:hypothetical protein